MLEIKCNDTFRSKMETKHDVRCNSNVIEWLNLFIQKPVLNLEYETLFEYQGLLMQGLHRIYNLIALDNNQTYSSTHLHHQM